MENTKNASLSKLVPVMLCFFAMGFVDLVGIASNYVKADLGLTDSQANIFPSLVFFWFLIFSVPTGMLMSRIGQKKTVLLSLIVTFASLLLPVFGDSYALMLISFSLLGIGNALMQTSLNPLLSNIVRGDRLASSLTFGQFVKAIASFLAPYIAMWGATQAIPSFDLGWRVLFPIYMVIAILAILLLNATQIEEEKEEGKPSTFGQCLALLGKPFILLCFIGIMCHVGIDVGTNTTAPKILMERIGMTLDDAAFATSLYFIFRTAGCFLGSFIRRLCGGLHHPRGVQGRCAPRLPHPRRLPLYGYRPDDVRHGGNSGLCPARQRQHPQPVRKMARAGAAGCPAGYVRLGA